MSLRRVLFNLTKTNSVFSLRFKNQKLYYYYVDKSNFPLIILTNALQYSSESPSKCWNCNFISKSELFCSKCKVLQEPPENLTYFDIMGIPKSYDVTVSEVQKKYKELQKLLHPDKFSRKSEKEKELSDHFSSLVNKAYSTLSHPLKRGLYMLKLNNVMISEETDNVNAVFLMEIMEKNEEIDEAENNEEKIKKLVEENERILSNLTKNVGDAFRKEDIKKAETLLIQMKYYDTINNRLKKLKHDLGIIE
ncbi:iron-sulfur cluster co-chaperone protein HscB isoform X1 [Osmia bicornis bicornis]|uniref:iron-sulfur cluster co-chaperone protein HscB isoform X1 n=1 Tax=Osmia bicornis bicornis TaxID=1437191 RepID=UPI001EAECEE2|nr:iron-sulfur cluster co-chaperone protein HscB isoform X1 [Osmia bicornis bicornis]